MNIIKFLVAVTLTTVSIYFLNTRITISDETLPPFGKFLDPFHGFWQNAIDRESKPLKTDQLPGLLDEVTLEYDHQLVPHIYAQHKADAFYMQGYVTARHRLWQMEFQTHAAGGRLTEIVGKKALGLDREKRRMGLTLGAENAMAFLSKDTLAMQIINAYCAGVNDYIRQLKKKDYPVEYKLLDYAPEAWKPIKTALLLTYMANILSSSEHDIENTNFLNTYGDALFNQLYPVFYEGQDPIIPQTHQWEERPSERKTLPEPTDVKISQYQHHQPSTLIGSNNWAISAKRSSTNFPMLANDPHLRLTLPSIWFQIHMVSPDCNTYGVSFPGAPNVIIGFNENIAWGVTNAGRDVRDWYKIVFTDENKSKYLHGGETLPTSIRNEIYKIRDGAEFEEKIFITHHGPVVYDDQYRLQNSDVNLALQWTAHRPTSELLTFYHLNRAKNHAEYLSALELYHAPAQNFVFASREGDIAIKQQGMFPQYDDRKGSFIKDGTDPEHDWQRHIPFDQNPHVLNPERGFVSSANQHPTDSTYPYIYDGIFEFFRNRRLNDLLEKSANVTIADHQKWQLDNYNLQAAESLPLLLKYLKKSNLNQAEKEVLVELENWNYINDEDLVAPSYYQFWWERFIQLTWDEMLEADHVMAVPHKSTTIQILRDFPNHAFFDRIATPQKETAPDIINQAFSESVSQMHPSSNDELASAVWWKVKSTEINHLARISAFSRKGIKCGGNKGILNATGKYWGPSWRMIVSLGDRHEAVGIYPGGQSGSPGNPYYDNFIDDWASGQYYPIRYSPTPSENNDQYLYSQKMKPAGK